MRTQALSFLLLFRHKAFFIHFLPRAIGSVRSGFKVKDNDHRRSEIDALGVRIVRHSREGIDEGFDQHADRSAIGSCLQTRARPARGNLVSFVMKSVKAIRSQRLQAGSGPAATHFLCCSEK